MSLRDVVASPVRRALATAVHYGWAWVCRHGEITPATPAGLRFRRLGEGTSIGFPAGAIFGERWIEVGAHTLIAPYVTLSAGFAPGLDLGPDPVVRIGSGCSIGRGNQIIGHQSIEIGDDVFTGPNVYITDQNHTYRDPAQPIGRQWPENNPVVIGDGCWIGTGAIVLPGTRLGRNVAVAGGAVVRGEFPDHCVIAGVPAKIVRSFDAAGGWEPPLAGRRPLVSLDELHKLAGLSAADLEALRNLEDPSPLAEDPLTKETG
ncbi:MAG TPA: acyltransferase [Streptosporangiaceae bacterium]|jgi:acetyltransferase-like isoleucine patch superfamily enzyme|nr:acyltransferase [Streptosporangiaceae bacterium]